MDLSIIIVSWNVKDLLQENLKSIYDNTTGIDFEVFVVDNDSSDGSAKMVAEQFPQVKLIAKNYFVNIHYANNWWTTNKVDIRKRFLGCHMFDT